MVADTSTADEAPSRIKARLAALSAFAESQGLTGYGICHCQMCGRLNPIFCNSGVSISEVKLCCALLSIPLYAFKLNPQFWASMCVCVYRQAVFDGLRRLCSDLQTEVPPSLVPCYTSIFLTFWFITAARNF